jgi:hypothetical protein
MQCHHNCCTFCLTLDGKNQENRFRADKFFGACWCIFVVVEWFCVPGHRRKMEQSPLNWISRLHENEGILVLPTR